MKRFITPTEQVRNLHTLVKALLNTDTIGTSLQKNGYRLRTILTGKNTILLEATEWQSMLHTANTAIDTGNQRQEEAIKAAFRMPQPADQDASTHA